MAKSLAEAIGAGARELRLGANVTLEQMAQAAKLYGLRWTSGRVGDFEAGRIAPTLPTLIAAAAALGKAIGRPVALCELIGGTGEVAVTDALALDRSVLSALLGGRPVEPPGSPAETRLTIHHRHKGAAPTDPGFVQEVRLGFRDSDLRVCNNIGIDRERGAAAMAALWGQPFSAERDERAGPDANAQHRGQVSRQLKAELQRVAGADDGGD